MKLSSAVFTWPRLAAWSLPIACGLYLMAYDGVQPLSRILAVITFLITCLPLAFWLRGNTRDIPSAELVSVYAGANFAIGALLLPPAITIHSRLVVFESAGYLLSQFVAALGVGGMAVTIIVWRIAWRHGGRRIAPIPVYRSTAFTLAAAAIGAGILAAVARVLGVWQLGGLTRFLNDLSLLAIGLLALQLYSGVDTRRSIRVALYLLVGGESLFGLASGMLEEAVMPVGVWLVVRTSLQRRLSLVLLVVLCLGFIALNIAKFQVRERTWFGQVDSVGGRLGAWGQALQDLRPDLIVGTGSEGAVAPWRQSMGRISLMQRFAWVRESTPLRVPYFHGESYKMIAYAVVPRLLWHNKPDMSAVTETLDYSYDLKDPVGGGSYSIGIGLFGEGYANFGLLGVVGVGVLFGTLLGLLNAFLNQCHSHPSQALYVGTCIGFLNGMGTTAGVLFGALAYNLVLSFTVLWTVSYLTSDGGRPRYKIGLPVTTAFARRRQ